MIRACVISCRYDARMPLPPDRGHLATERRHERSASLDALSVPECVSLMIQDHRSVAVAVDSAANALGTFIDALIPRVREGGRLIYLGAGTSGRLGVLDASECPPTFQSDPAQVVGVIAGGDASLRRSSEGREDEADGAAEALQRLALASRDTVLGIAAGGTTPYVLGGIRIARDAGAMTGLLTCVPQDSPCPNCDHLIVLDTGPELLTGSTRLKAGSATKLALNIISTTLFVQLGKVYSNLMVDVRATNAKLSDRALRILIELCPELTRRHAAELLDRADGHLKRAIIMQRLDVDAAAAEQLLTQHDGRLRAVLDGR
jgi:N-acetylmuramic acid 6-phosphate etherase